MPQTLSCECTFHAERPNLYFPRPAGVALTHYVVEALLNCKVRKLGNYFANFRCDVFEFQLCYFQLVPWSSFVHHFKTKSLLQYQHRH